MRTSPWGRDSGLPGWVFIGARQVRRDGKVITKAEPGGELPASGSKCGGRVMSHGMWKANRADVSEESALLPLKSSFAATPNRFPYGGILL